MDRALEQAGKPLFWHETADGGSDIAARPQDWGDVIIARKDMPTSYHLAVVVDDAAQGVTHVVRGRDIMPSTHAHRLLQAVLDLPEPVYRHHSLVLDAEGNRLAKRLGAPTLADWRAQGLDGVVLANRLRAGYLPIGFGFGG